MFFLIQSPYYKSDATDFLNQLKADNPKLSKSQKEGRSLLWDKEINFEVQNQTKLNKVKQKPYVYQTN